MIWNLIKKQLLLLTRSPQELFVILLMPLILITILGFALSSYMDSNNFMLEAKIAIVEHDDEKKQIEKITEELAEHIPPEMLETMEPLIEQASPLSIMKNDILGAEQFEEHFTIETVSANELEQIKSSDEYDVIIEFPKDFTYNILAPLFLQKETYTPEIVLYKNEGKIFAPNMIEDILRVFQDHYSRMTILSQHGITDVTILEQLSSELQGDIQTVTSREPISSMEYYTAGMACMFVLFVSSFISGTAIREKQLHVFDRIILANTSRWTYFSSIFLSSFFVAFLQLMVIFTITKFAFQIQWDNITALLTLCIVLSFAIGGLTAFLTAMNYRLNSEGVSMIFGSVGVGILAFFGGSYIPTSQITPLIQQIGEFTPNGAGMTSFLKLLQGYDLNAIITHIIFLLLFGVLMLIVAVFCFPKRGNA